MLIGKLVREQTDCRARRLTIKKIKTVFGKAVGICRVEERGEWRKRGADKLQLKRKRAAAEAARGRAGELRWHFVVLKELRRRTLPGPRREREREKKRAL